MSAEFNKATLISYKIVFIPTPLTNVHTHRYTQVKGVLVSVQLKQVALKWNIRPAVRGQPNFSVTNMSP